MSLSFFEARDSRKRRGLLLAQAALLGAGGGVGNQQQRADDGHGHRVGGGGEGALNEDQVDGFLVDQDVEDGSHHQPGNGIADDLNDVEGEDVFTLEDALFDAGALEGKTEGEARHAAGDDPAPPGRAVQKEIAEGMADEGNQKPGDGAKQGGEERGHAVGGLDLGFRHGRWNFDVHE